MAHVSPFQVGRTRISAQFDDSLALWSDVPASRSSPAPITYSETSLRPLSTGTSQDKGKGKGIAPPIPPHPSHQPADVARETEPSEAHIENVWESSPDTPKRPDQDGNSIGPSQTAQPFEVHSPDQATNKLPPAAEDPKTPAPAIPSATRNAPIKGADSSPPNPPRQCDKCVNAPPGEFCNHLSCSPESDDTMPLPAGFHPTETNLPAFAEQGSHIYPEAVHLPSQPTRNNSWSDLFEQGPVARRDSTQDFNAEDEKATRSYEGRQRSPKMVDWILFAACFVALLALIIPLIVFSSRLNFTIDVQAANQTGTADWSLLTSYELQFRKYCVNYRSTDRLYQSAAAQISSECHKGMSDQLFETTKELDLQPVQAVIQAATAAQSLGSNQKRLVWSTWGLYVYLATAIGCVAFANWRSFYPGDNDAYWLTANTFILAISAAPVASCVVALKSQVQVLTKFVATYNQANASLQSSMSLKQTGVLPLEAFYWASLAFCLALLLGIWAKFKLSRQERDNRRVRKQSLAMGSVDDDMVEIVAIEIVPNDLELPEGTQVLSSPSRRASSPTPFPIPAETANATAPLGANPRKKPAGLAIQTNFNS